MKDARDATPDTPQQGRWDIPPDATPTPDATPDPKAALRSRLRAARRARPRDPEEGDLLARRGLALVRASGAGVVACFVSTPTEPDTTALRRALHAAGVRVLLPVTLPHGHLRWVVDDLTATRPPTGTDSGTDGGTDSGTGTGGTGQGADPDEVDLVLAPALAVDTSGRRLGQGGGYYDRLLAGPARRRPVFAVVHDEEVLDATVTPVPVQEHDVPVDGALTAHRLLRLSPPQASG